MRIASIVFGMIMLLGYHIETSLPNWMELTIIVVHHLSATSLILVPVILTFLEGMKKEK